MIGLAHRLPLPLPLAPHILPSSSWTRRPTSRKPSAKPPLIFLLWNPTLWHALSSLGIWGLRQTRIWFGPLTPDHLGISSIQCQEWPREFSKCGWQFLFCAQSKICCKHFKLRPLSYYTENSITRNSSPQNVEFSQTFTVVLRLLESTIWTDVDSMDSVE